MTHLKITIHKFLTYTYKANRKIKKKKYYLLLGYGLKNPGSSTGRGIGNFWSPNVQTGSRTSRASCSVCSWGSFRRGKVTGSWHWPLIRHQRSEKVEQYFYCPPSAFMARTGTWHFVNTGRLQAEHTRNGLSQNTWPLSHRNSSFKIYHSKIFTHFSHRSWELRVLSNFSSLT